MTNKRAIILAAGIGSRFSGRVKGLIEFQGETLLGRQVRLLKKYGVEDIVIVVGHSAEKIVSALSKYEVTYLYNEAYAVKDNAESLRRVLSGYEIDKDAFIFDGICFMTKNC
jgi:choline kinase